MDIEISLGHAYVAGIVCYIVYVLNPAIGRFFI